MWAPKVSCGHSRKSKMQVRCARYKGREGRVGITLVSPGQSGDAQILSEIVTPMN